LESTDRIVILPARDDELVVPTLAGSIYLLDHPEYPWENLPWRAVL
jgi:hypothetical protein